VLAGAGPGIPAYDQEVFGPVACVTRFSTLDEAVELASDTEYGLALGIFTADVATGLALAERIPTGTAHINDQTLRDDAHVPFGGVRNSGNSSRFGTAQPTSRPTPTPDGSPFSPRLLPILSDPDDNER
jgi:NAD-dependent aldehyde dehydrogenases